jgi:5-formyltetrahydrofolate cyclo-ligase
MSEENKTALRARYRLARNEFVGSLDEQGKALAFSVAPGPLSNLLLPGRVVAAYIASGSEANPAKLLEQAHACGCITALPFVVSRAAPMRFLQWSPGDILMPGPLNLYQPAKDAPECVPDVALVPLIAFDDSMMRLGQGAGHYDRALSRFPEAIAIGIAWSVQRAPALPADPWDVPLDAVLTEKAWMTS